MLTDSVGRRITLDDVNYVPGSQDRILSMMKFRREHKADFKFTSLESFTMTAANGFKLVGNSIVDILYTALSSQPQANVTATRSAAKRQIVEVMTDVETESEIQERSNSESESRQQFRKRICRRSHSPDSSSPLTCSPANLWHLQYGHASATTLRK